MGGKTKLNVIRKKRISNILSVIMFFCSSFLAFYCIFLRVDKLFFIFDKEDIHLFAAKFILPRGKLIFSEKYSSIDNLSIEKKQKRFEEIKLNKKDSLNTIKNTNPEIIPKKEIPYDDEPHDPNEKKYKIIESQFSSSGIKYENFYIKNTTGYEINVAQEMNNEPEINITCTDKPQVLIIHTHTSESYLMKDRGFFYESFYPRTNDNNKNVVRVGEEIAQQLIKSGINVIHDLTAHDTPTYNGSYSRAAKTIEKNLKENSSIQVVIDVHRDSMGSRENGKVKPTFVINGQKAAQLMLISGCDKDGTLGFPNWQKNLRLSLRLQKYCESMFPGITRPLNFSCVKYNMNITPGSLLVEIGSDVNTLEEAVYTGAMFGKSLANLLNDLKK